MPAQRMVPLLEVKDLTKHFGGLSAVETLNMVVRRGEILGLIGPNGAGKTTTFNLITGFLRPTQGRLFYEGEDITDLKPHEITKKGIVRSFQANILFMDKTVKDNVLLGFHCKFKRGFLEEIINTKRYRHECNQFEEKASEILDFFHLGGYSDQLARNLPHGYQRMLGVAVALAATPDLLLLDEPVSGMNDEESKGMMELIKKIQERGVTIFLVEHNMKAVMGNCERIVVMEHGIKIAEGPPSDIAHDEKVIEAYLGTAEYDV